VRWVIALCLFFCSLTSCTTPTDNQSAINSVIAQGFLRPGSTPGSLLFGPGLLTQGQVSEGSSCTGAIGSVLPPFSLNQCAMYTLMGPMVMLSELHMSLNGVQGDPYIRHVYLNGIEKFWVHQSEPNNCWAAALETARNYLHLHYISQNELLESAQEVCPQVSRQTAGADTYQIVSTIRYRLKQYDQQLTTPGICSRIECVVDKLSEGRPIIMLGAGHAVLLVGMDYYNMPSSGPNVPSVLVLKMYILDPSGNRQVETRSTFSLCKEDIFMFY
jgi:hypothetical protein